MSLGERRTVGEENFGRSRMEETSGCGGDFAAGHRAVCAAKSSLRLRNSMWPFKDRPAHNRKAAS